MTFEKTNMKKMCSFCVSDWHIATTIIPYIKEKTEKNEKVISIFEKNLENKIVELVKRMNVEKTVKNKMNNIDMKTKDWKNYEQFEYFIEQNYTQIVNIIINGSEEYINKINSYLDKWYEKNVNRMKQEGSKINVVNCYNMNEGANQGIILQKYSYILNTTGEKKINEYLNEKIKIAK